MVKYNLTKVISISVCNIYHGENMKLYLNKPTAVSIVFSSLILFFLLSSSAYAGTLPAISQHNVFGTAQPLINTPADYKKGELIVKFKDSVEVDEYQNHVSPKSLSSNSAKDLDSLNALNKDKAKSMKRLFKEKKKQKHKDDTIQLSKIDTDPLSNIYIIETDKDEDIIKLAEKYRNSPLVEYAEPNYKVHALEIPDDANYSLQWSHQNAESEAGWDIETGSQNIIIAILDTGIDFDHPDLDEKIWSNTGEIPGNKKDDDSNGYIDDTVGWDFENNDNYPDDDHFHGTHCSGIAAAETNNSEGVAGVCWNCTVMPVKCLDDEGYGSWTSVALSVRYAADNGADIISLSLGDESSSSLMEDAVNYAHDKGVIIFASAGNNNNDDLYYPAYYDNVISVTASNSADGKAYFSTYGYWTDIAAPGVGIYSTVLNSYAYKSGTSMSCPFVAGVAGLLLSKNSNLSVDMLETILKSSTDPVISPTKYMGTGRINVKKALEKADSGIVAKLNNSLKGITTSSTVSITGTAKGAGFVNYSLYYAEGIYPENWTEFSNSTSQVTDAELGQFNTVNIENNLYTVKLQVIDINNNTFIDYVHINIDNQPLDIKVNSPSNTTYHIPAILFDITSGLGAIWCGYSIDSEANITLDNDAGTHYTYDHYNWTDMNTYIDKGQHNVVFYCKDQYGTVNSTEPIWFNISANTITGCSVLDNADTEYYLILDIENYFATDACMNITASNITLYCQDHLVDGLGSVNTYGIYIGADDATISDCHISQWDYGIYMDKSSNSTVTGNIIEESLHYGLYLDDAQTCMIYNNLFKNTYNIGFGTAYHTNSWNTTMKRGDRIYSLGKYIGGNYWTHPASDGYSDTCTDSDQNGFCDSAYTIATKNIDYLPLSNKYHEYSLSISLYKIQNSTGLNLITLPLEHSFTTAEDLCGNITSAETITRWDPVTQQYKPHVCGYQLMGNFNLSDGEGYFVSIEQNTNWTLTGAVLSLLPIFLFKIPDNTGLNLISLPYNSIISPFTAEGLCQNITSAETVTRWDSVTQQYKPHVCGYQLMGNFNLSDGEGYFISVTQNTTWVPK